MKDLRHVALACISMTAVIAAVPASAEVPTPPRPLTPPQSITSPENAAARPIPLEDLISTRGMLSAAWSADGRQLFFATNLTGRYNIWRVDAAGGWPVQLTQSDEAQRGLAVSPDGSTLYFQQDHGGDEQYDILAVPTAGGAVRNLTATPEVRESGALIAPDGKTIAISTKLRSQGQTNLALLDPDSGKVRALTAEADPQWDWSPVAWADQGRTLIANRSFTDSSAGEVWAVDIASGKARRLLGAPKTRIEASGASSDGTVLSVTSNAGTGQDHAGIYSIKDKRWRWLAPTPWSQEAGAMAPDGKSFVVTTNTDGRTEIALADVATLAVRPVPLQPGVNAPAGAVPFSPDSKRLLVLRSGANAPGQPTVIDLASGGVAATFPLAVASLDPATLPGSAIVTYPSFDGTRISAVLTIPFNARRDGHNPAIVMPHGGPTGQALDSFSGVVAAFASRGYFVIQPNPRGSTGYGQAFQSANYQDLGGGDLKDVLAAKDFLVSSGYVDPARVGITGGSYGGFMTLMAIGRAPDAFAAAVQMFGIIDWRTMWEHEDAGLQAYQKSLLGDPATYPKVYDATSPLTWLKAAKAPLLSLQGDNDIRVPRGQAQQVTDALKARGATAEVVFYPGEGHGFYKRENQLDSLRRRIEWFDRYLKPKAQ
ncbi:S9 family peptidase [Novosphingobium olei]|uniref:S9 family peptidase n=1 Tax=Novosphingobium olei TaxID=2728851 RepID=UPI00308F5484|nr:S9 family peptidase [Novosphingobium olei]